MDEDQNGTATEQPADDIRSALTAAIAGAEAPATQAETTETETDAGADVGATPEKKPDAETGAAAPADGQKPETDPAKPAAIEPPANWAAADKEMFKKVPPEAQAFLLAREKAMTADYTRKTQEIAYLKKEYEPVDKLFEPYKAQLAQNGHTPRSLIEGWSRVELALTQGKAIDVIRGIVQGYKVDPRAVVAALSGQQAPGAQGQGSEQPPAPVAQLPPEVAQRLSAHDQWIQQQQERERAAAERQRQDELARVSSDVEQFQSAKDDKGNLLHPHFADVEAAMTDLVLLAKARGAPVPSLKELYDQAVWASPSTRAKELSARQAAAEEQRRVEARAKAAAAKRAGSSVTGAPGTGQAATPGKTGGMTLREQILAAAEDNAA